MPSKIIELVKKIESLAQNLRCELAKEREEFWKKYWYYIEQRRVIFNEKAKKLNKSFKENIFKYIFVSKVRHLLSAPFIYSMIIPTVILDIFVTIYQFICFPLYWIPKVERRKYIIYDKRFLDYLNILQKVHCLYCTYVNWLYAYAREIAWRTERYWCPIKHANNVNGLHEYYFDFADYGDPKWFKENLNKFEVKKDDECKL